MGFTEKMKPVYFMAMSVALRDTILSEHARPILHIYIDESIHDEHGFMLLGFVVCRFDPQQRLETILKEFGLPEYHSLDRMEGNKQAQALRSKMRAFVNNNCRWGVMVFPNGARNDIYQELPGGLRAMTLNLLKPKESISVCIDEGIVSVNSLDELKGIEGISGVSICKSHEVMGIQLADLVAALCGVRLREEISGKPKMLTYGKESGFEPPIEAELGYELWASLRYSMCRKSEPIEEDEPTEFETAGYGFFLSERCSDVLAEKAEKLFGRVYLGCIH